MAQQAPKFKKMSLRKWFKDQPDYGNHSYRVPAAQGPTYQDIKEKLRGRMKDQKKQAKEWKEGQDNLEKERMRQRRKVQTTNTPRVAEKHPEKDSPRVQGKIRTFQDQFQKLSETNKSIQNNLKKLESSKKEKDCAQVKESLGKQLDEAIKLLENLQEKVGQTQRDLTSPNTNVSKEKAPRQKGRLDPEESEMAYELKAQMMKNVEAQNSKLRAEITLHEKIVEVKHLHNENQKLQEESNLSHTNVVKLLSRFEKKAKETDQKLKAFAEELAKANRLAFRYKDLYDQERQRNRGKALSPRPDDREETDRLTMPSISGRHKLSNSSNLLGNNVRVNDVIRKNESLVDENESLRKEIVKLRQDNAILLKKTKHAMADRDSILHELETCRMSREDVVKRFQKEKAQNQVLARAAARRAQDFVFEKRQQHSLEESLRWRVVYNDRSGPISAYGSAPRTYSHAVPKNVDLPRGMLPVQDYATANQSSA